MLLQTNSYVVPKEKRAEHARLLVRFKHALARLGCDHFEAYEQVPANWGSGESTGRFVQIMRFRDRKHQQQVQAAERTDTASQTLIREFCDLVNLPYQQQQGLFAAGFYMSAIVSATQAPDHGENSAEQPAVQPPATSPAESPETQRRAAPKRRPPTMPQPASHNGDKAPAPHPIRPVAEPDTADDVDVSAIIDPRPPHP